MKAESKKLLCTPEDVYALAGVTDEAVRKLERDRIEQLIIMEPIFLWGDNFERKIRGKERQAGSHVAHGVALKSGLISNEAHAKVIKEALNTSEFFAGTYREIIEKWLNNNWSKLTALGGGIGYLLLRKGEFEHYDEVKGYLDRVHKEGGVVRILKGRDNRTSLVVDDLHRRGIPVRVYDDCEPKIRLYICDNRCLYFVSTPRRIFLGFEGSDARALEAVKQFFEQDWKNRATSHTPGTLYAVAKTSFDEGDL